MSLAQFGVLFMIMGHMVIALDNGGLGRTPPMGWRSWNCYHGGVNQQKMVTAIEAFIDTTRGISLIEAGYTSVGLDDGYQACRSGINGSFHNASGYPLIDRTKFPDMKKMTSHAHALGLRTGWYVNNCICNEHQNVSTWGPPQTLGKLPFMGRGPLTDGLYHYEGDVQATLDFGFDGINIDSCGEYLNLTEWAELFNASGHAIMIENCHQGYDGPGDWGDGGHLNRGVNKVPPSRWCPFNFFRTSGDIFPYWNNIIDNLLTVDKYQPWSVGEVRTGPGCFAYPDSLEVGNLRNSIEDRSHFGAWIINSSPLILGHDLANNTINDRVWPFITNTDAIKVSQSFAQGDTFHPGGLVKIFPATPPTQYLWTSSKATGGWEMRDDGQPGAIKHTKTGLCINPASAHHATEQYYLSKCTGDRTQDFVLESNGDLHPTTDAKLCVAMRPGYQGPRVISFACDAGLRYGKMAYNASDGSLHSVPTSKLAALYVVAHSTLEDGILLYAKPQPNNATAIFAINNTPNPANVSIKLADIRYNSFRATNVLDLWQRKPITRLLPGAMSFPTDSISPRDSRFYLLKPE